MAQPAPVTSRLSLIHDLSKTRQLHHDSWEASQPSPFFIKATLRISKQQFKFMSWSQILLFFLAISLPTHSYPRTSLNADVNPPKKVEQDTLENMRQTQQNIQYIPFGLYHCWTERPSKPIYIDLELILNKFQEPLTKELESTSQYIHVLVWNTLTSLNLEETKFITDIFLTYMLKVLFNMVCMNFCASSMLGKYSGSMSHHMYIVNCPTSHAAGQRWFCHQVPQSD